MIKKIYMEDTLNLMYVGGLSEEVKQILSQESAKVKNIAGIKYVVIEEKEEE